MARDITINGTVYSMPEDGTDPPWGDEVADIVEAIVDVLDTLSSDNDILNTSFTIVDNQSSAANVTGLSFDAALVRSAVIEYDLFRSGSTPKDESGTLWLSYDGTDWEISRESNNDVGVTFTCTNAGQVQYTSSSVGSTGKMHFRARSHAQA